MRAVPLLLLSLVLVCAALSGTAWSQAGDRDCTDFDTQEEAQAFFDSQGAGDPHDLDADGDGKACETLPSDQSVAAVVAGAPTAQPAQAAGAGPRTPRTPRTPRRPGEGSSPVSPTASSTPKGGLPETGGPVKGFGLAGSAFLIVGLALIAVVARRRFEPAESPVATGGNAAWGDDPLVGW